MEETSKKNEEKQEITEVTTIPYSLERKEEIINNGADAISKQQIINQAVKFHLQGKISEAAKYYQYCINQGFNY